MTAAAARLLPVSLLVLFAVVLGGCATSVAVSSFSGEKHAVAQKVADLEADTIARHQQRVCADDLSSALVARLNKAPGGCERAIKVVIEP